MGIELPAGVTECSMDMTMASVALNGVHLNTLKDEHCMVIHRAATVESSKTSAGCCL